jgi:DNA polymerase-3 subunit delta
LRSRYSEFIQRKPTLLPVYIVYGEDALLMRRVVDALLNAALPEAEREFNLDVLDGATTTVAQVIALATNLPFLSSRRVVWVREAEKLKELDKLADALNKGRLPATTHLILQRSPNAERREGERGILQAALDRAVDKLGAIVECSINPRTERAQLMKFISDEAQRWGKKIAPTAVALLMARAGHDFFRLTNEIHKLAHFVGDAPLITNTHVEQMVAKTVEEKIFALTDAIGKRAVGDALHVLHDLLDHGHAPEVIIGQITRHLRLLFQARFLHDKGYRLRANLSVELPQEVAAALPQANNLLTFLQSQTWAAARYEEQVRHFTQTQLSAAFERTLLTDLQLKGIEGNVENPRLALELLVVDLCGDDKRAPQSARRR